MKQSSSQWLLAGGTLLVLAVSVLFLQPRRGAGPVTQRTTANSRIDEDAPEDPRYQQALRAGLAHDYGSSYQQFRQLASAEPGTNTEAWSLYQASLAAEALKDVPARDARLEELRRLYPAHRLALRTAPATPPATSRRPAADCGPRALLYLCERAGHPASLAELRRSWGTDQHGTTLARLEEAARSHGFRSSALKADAAFIRRVEGTGIAWVNGDHFVVFEPAPGQDRISLVDPNLATPRVVSAADLAKASQGILLFVAWGERALPQ